MPKVAKRLFEQFHPEHYDLQLSLDSDKMTFSGQVVITGKKIARPSQRLTFHQRGLKVTAASVVHHLKGESKTLQVDRINTHDSQQEVRLHTKEKAYPGDYTVTLSFSGKITDKMLGIYPCYFTHDGTSKKLIATQFESHYAREAFPCIDEPEAKATFDLTLTTEAGVTVLGNTPVKKQQTKSDALVTSFETTPKMSTYLLAFVYGEMHCVEAKTKDGVLVRSWSTVAQDKRSLEYSVHEGVRLLEFFTDYFGVAYPLPKCDQVALPDFDAGAMENWGLITYREIALLADAVNRSISNEQYVSLVVAHELSHQWFGNLVTMQWWEDLWLNESFASLMEHLALDAIHPDWQQWEHYVAMDVVSTSSRDVYSDIQPVSVKVTDPDLIDTLFDPGIVYAKGGRLLKMLRDYIGDEAFQKGLKWYFKKHAYENATRNDLWQALSDVSGQDLVSLMTVWIEKPGMPVLEVTQKGKTLDITQMRFLLDQAKDRQLWPVPLLANKTLAPELITKQHEVVKATTNDYVVLNQHGSGHYFVRYTEPDHRATINGWLQARHLAPETRVNVLNDAYMLARKGLAPLTEALETVAGCASEDRDNVWAAISRILAASSQLTEGNKGAEQRLKALRCNLATDWHQKLGWDDGKTDDPNTKQLRHTALAYMTAGEDEKVIKEALQRYEAVKSVADLPAEIRATILGAAVRHGPVRVPSELLAAYPESTAEVQLDITSALASTKKPEVAREAYCQALGKKGFVRNQDVMRWLAIFVRNHYVRPVVWEWIETNWEWIESAIGDSKSFDYLPVYLASVINTPEWQKKYRAFFGSKESRKTLERNIKVGYADIAARVVWRQREEAGILQWLESHLD